MGHQRIIVLCLVGILVGSAGCAPSFRQPQAPLQRQTATIPITALHGKGTVYLLPMGNFPDAMAQDLLTYFKGKYGLTLHLLPHLSIPSTAINSTRHQAVAESLIGLMDAQAPQLPGGAGTANDNTVLIGLTSVDMYSRDIREWSFIFSTHDESDAVISCARMDPSNFGQPPDPLLLQKRLRKMVSKDIGVLYYHLPQSNDPQSVLFGPIGGLEDLDRIGEDY